MKVVYKFFIALVSVVIMNPLFASTHPNALCTQEQYVVGFFNGVWNTERQASRAREKLSEIILSDTSNSADIDSDSIVFESFYNHTGSVAGASAFQDVAEVFIQRADEIAPNYSENFELFWSSISGDADGFFEAASNIVLSQELNPANTTEAAGELVIGLLSDLYTDISTEVAGVVSDLVSNPPTASDYQRHSSRIKTLALEGNNLLLVAHSQGNLFVNHAYDAALSIENYTASNIGVVHVAPASSITNGPHVLADIDAVINGLRVFGLETVPPITVQLPLSHLLSDPSGHTFIGTYLNTTLASFTQTKDFLMSELGRLEVPDTIEAQQGAFTLTLTWNGSGDVDLHTFEPSGTQVYYDNQNGSSGFLDVDNIIGLGPEHYYASCNPDILQPGLYRVGLNNFDEADGRIATVQVSTPYVADLVTKSMTMGSSLGPNGDANPSLFIDVQVSRDQDGNFDISAQ